MTLAYLAPGPGSHMQAVVGGVARAAMAAKLDKVVVGG